MEITIIKLEYLIFISIFFFLSSLIILIFNISLKKAQENLKNLLIDAERLLQEKTKSCEILENLCQIKEEKIGLLENNLNELETKKENLHLEKFELKRELSLLELRYDNLQEKSQEWEKLKDESINNAKAAIFEIGNQLGNKLIADHKRELEESKKHNSEIISQTTDKLHHQFQNIVNSVGLINDQVQKSHYSFEKIRKALLSPSGAGSLAEITLENILKASGLMANRDYIMQLTVLDNENNRLRPDAIIFLPGNNIMVIDSKASKFFINFEEEHSEEIIKEKIKNTARIHLKDLINREYLQYVKNYVEKNHNFKVNYVSMVMFLPSESSLEKIQFADNKFITDSWEKNIYPAGPVGLVNILSHAKFMISERDMASNHQEIILQIEKLLTSFGKIYDSISRVGNNLQTTTKNFDKLAASFNSNFIPKVKNLEKLGLASVQTSKIKKIDRIQFVTDQNLEAAEKEEELLLQENT